MATSLFGVGTSVNVNASGTLVPQSFVGTASQVLFTITAFTYTPGTNSLLVFINGQRQVVGRDFTETSSATFTLVEGVVAGDFVDIIGFPLIALTAVTSGSVTYTHAGAITLRTVQNFIDNQSISILDFGAICDGVSDDAPATNLAIAYIKTLTYPSGVITFPALTRWNSSITLTGTHGIVFRGNGPAYTVGAEAAMSRIKFYGTGDAIILSGLLAAQSAFQFENLRLDNIGFPQTNNGISCLNAGFSAGLQVIGSLITGFSSGVSCNTGQPFGYVYCKNSAFYYNATWGLAIAGNIIDIEGCVISNNGPLWSSANNTFNAAPVGGGLLIEGVSTTISIRGGCDFEGLTVAIFIRGTYGASIENCYFESIAKCAIQATSVIGLTLSKNYQSSNTEARTIVLDNCSNVKVIANGYSPNVYCTGLSNYEIEGNKFFLAADLNRTVNNTQFLFKDKYGTSNVDINDTAVSYYPAPSTVISMTGPVLQAEIGPFGVPINQYVSAGNGYFIGGNLAATAGQYIYFSILIRNVTLLQAIVRDVGEANPIVVKSITQYDKEWSVVTVGGLVAVSQTYRLTFLVVGAETIQLGGYISYLSATPIYKPIFSFATFRCLIKRRNILVYSVAITPDMSIGDVQSITVTNATAFTINAPLNAVDGDKLTVLIRNASGGVMGVITWNVVFKMLAFTVPTNGNSCAVTFEYDGANWIQFMPQTLQVPN